MSGPRLGFVSPPARPTGLAVASVVQKWDADLALYVDESRRIFFCANPAEQRLSTTTAKRWVVTING
jgi:hypothetical protein